jgi:uncharacterized membrane protein
LIKEEINLNPQNMNVTIMLAVLLVGITTISLTKRSAISPTKKTLIYATTLLIFHVGVIFFIMFKAYQKPIEIDPSKREVPPIVK